MARKHTPQLKIRRFWKIKPFARVKKSGKIYSRKRERRRTFDEARGELEPRVLGLDVGERRIGVAMSDLLGVTAQPLCVIDAQNALQKLKELAAKHDVELFVIGYPLTLRGEKGDKARDMEEFATNLKNATGVPTKLVDERLSSKAAERALREMGRKPSRDKGSVDQIAAVMILQSYLDTRSRLAHEE
ncbi:MAG: Holliday junction resolvase RuvX [bacterium]